MKRFACLAAAVVAVSFVGAGLNLITQRQGLTGGNLETLGFEWVKPKNNLVGGPQTYAVTDAVIQKLQSLKKSGKHLIVDNDGAITLK